MAEVRRHGHDGDRRLVLAGGVAALATPSLALGRRLPAPRWTGRQFHNQPEDSHVHRFLVELWSAVEAQTDGALKVVVHAQNIGLPGREPSAQDLLEGGKLDFFAIMGGVLANTVPVADIQGVPFAFTRYPQIDRANEGALGDLITQECAAKGVRYFKYGLLEQGFRQMIMADRPIARPADLAGVKMRVPDGPLFRDLFTAFGAEPVTVNIAELYQYLKDRRVDGQENALAVVEANKLYEVTRYVSMTSHMWSGLNIVANMSSWNSLQSDVQAVVERNLRRSVGRQRRYTRALNQALETGLARRGMIFNRPEAADFRSALGAGLYRRLRSHVGTQAWALLQQEVGALPA